MDDVLIYHNPDCGTSRNTLGLIRNAGIEPHVIEYLKCPPSRAMLQALIARMGIAVRDLIRVKGTPYHDLGLDDPSLTDLATRMMPSLARLYAVIPALVRRASDGAATGPTVRNR